MARDLLQLPPVHRVAVGDPTVVSRWMAACAQDLHLLGEQVAAKRAAPAQRTATPTTAPATPGPQELGAVDALLDGVVHRLEAAGDAAEQAAAAAVQAAVMRARTLLEEAGAAPEAIERITAHAPAARPTVRPCRRAMDLQRGLAARRLLGGSDRTTAPTPVADRLAAALRNSTETAATAAQSELTPQLEAQALEALGRTDLILHEPGPDRAPVVGAVGGSGPEAFGVLARGDDDFWREADLQGSLRDRVRRWTHRRRS